MSGLGTLKAKVEEVLKEIPPTRDNDKLLTWRIWECYYGVRGTVEMWQFMTLPSQSNIQRIRAKFQNDKKQPKYLPTSERVALQRGLNIERWRKSLGYGELFPL